MTAVLLEERDYHGHSAVVMRSADLELVVIPALGGKLAALRFLPSNRQWLWQDETRPYRRAVYGDAFDAYDISGFDECFPSIDECFYPDHPWKGVAVPDHGELWSLPWDYRISAGELHLEVYGIRFPYRFEKRLALPGPGRCRIAYRVTNLSPYPLKYIWSAHPMFAIERGMRIHIPGRPRMWKEFSVGGRIGPDSDRGRTGYLSEHIWPFAESAAGHRSDLRNLDYPEPPATDKVLVESPGWCALLRPATGEYIRLAAPPGRVPRIGVCVNMGAWPFAGRPAEWVALEPCTGPSRLDSAIQRGEHATLDPKAAHEWTVDLQVGASPGGSVPPPDLD